MQSTQYFSLAILFSSILYVAGYPRSYAMPPEPPNSAPDTPHLLSALPCSTVNTFTSTYNAIKDSRYRWKYFNIQLDPGHTEKERRLINDAMWKLSQVLPCVGFGIWQAYDRPSGDYVRIVRGANNGCSSYLGKLGGVQYMQLAEGCMYEGTILHEMLHALGLDHEQNRPDRDDYVTILWQNIYPGEEHNFQKGNQYEYDTYGIEYNPKSIMHYGAYDFSKNTEPTIRSIRGQNIGTDGTLKPTDIQKLKLMYNC